MSERHVQIVQNISREGPGIIAQVLDDHQIPYLITDYTNGDNWPNLSNASALIVLGGPNSANDPTPKMQREVSEVRTWVESDKPYLGICLGMQVLGTAAGVKVVENRVKEIGLTDQNGDPYMVELFERGLTDPLFKGLPQELKVFHLHGEAVLPNPRKVNILGFGFWCTSQIIKVGKNAYGFQGHFEVTPQMVSTWLKEDPDLLNNNPEKVAREYASVAEELREIAYPIFANFVQLIKA